MRLQLFGSFFSWKFGDFKSQHPILFIKPQRPWDSQLNNLLLWCTFLFRILNWSSGKTDKDQNTYWPYHHHLIECEVKKNQLSTPRPVVDNVSIASLEHEILIDLKNSHTSLEIEKIYLQDAQVWLKVICSFIFQGTILKASNCNLVNWLLSIATTYNR